MSFSKPSHSDLQVFIGGNGVGKTNLLNAINWCLYGDEPHLSGPSGLPLLNLKTIDEAADGDDRQVQVEVSIEADNAESVVLARKQRYKIYIDGDKKHTLPSSSEFQGKLKDRKGNTRLLTPDEASSYVERFVPKKIRDFFFFDGERLDTYLQEATGQRIQNAVLNVSQMDLLDRIYEKLDTFKKEMTREAGKKSVLVEDARAAFERSDEQLREIDRRITDCRAQIDQASSEALEYEKKLIGLPATQDLQKRKGELKATKQQKEEFLDEKEAERRNLLFDYGRILLPWSAVKNTMQVIAEKEVKGEIPPRVNPRLLEDILKAHRCNICGQTLDRNAEERVENLLRDIELSSNVARILVATGTSLASLNEKAKGFKDELMKVTREIDRYEKDLEDIQQQINDIDRQLSGYDIEKVREWNERHRVLEEIKASKQEELGGLKMRLEDAEKQAASFKARLEEELGKEEKVKRLKQQIDFCQKALSVIEKTKTSMMNETRDWLESETKGLFLRLTWKKETFKDVKIEPDFSIRPIHVAGAEYELIGSLSAGERELLALSFTLALHKVSGFDAPILIDTPVARISGEPRENFANVLAEVSKLKQSILLFTPAEYSTDVAKVLDREASNIFHLTPGIGEKETSVEVLKVAA